ncbi:hypothetical protein ACHAW6_001459, partial [Cyclotella cf. meneghiniana]
VDGWYLNTSAEHYRDHNCHVKHTNSERLSNTIQFQHKSITNPSLSPADKLMLALANCKEILSGHLKGEHKHQIGWTNASNHTTSKGGHQEQHPHTSKGGSNYNNALIASSSKHAHNSFARSSQTSSSGANTSKMDSPKYYNNNSSPECTTSPQYSIMCHRCQSRHTSNAIQTHSTQACLQPTHPQ